MITPQWQSTFQIFHIFRRRYYTLEWFLGFRHCPLSDGQLVGKASGNGEGRATGNDNPVTHIHIARVGRGVAGGGWWWVA